MSMSPFPSSVNVFSPGQSAEEINAIVNAAYANNGGQVPCNNGEFSNQRYAFLFQPGVYDPCVTVPVGYYTTVMGLGMTPGDTLIPNVYCNQSCSQFDSGSLSTVWRSAENFSTPATRLDGTMEWAVSMAAPLRRIEAPNVQLWSKTVRERGFASGGFMADCNIFGTVDSGSQQQWMSRNCRMNWSGGLWNMVFTGCTGQIPETTTFSGHSTEPAFTNVDLSPVIAEPPYIVYDTDKNVYILRIPQIEYNKIGPTINCTNAISVTFCEVYVVQDPTTVTAAEINAEIEAGRHIILTPGIYKLEDSIRVTKPVVILGIGFPTLIASGRNPCIVVSDNLVRKDGSGIGVQIKGILLQAGARPSRPTSSLLQWGTSNNKPAHGHGFLYDCFARVGGPANPAIEPVSATMMVQINNDKVVCDNLWLWRADHWSTKNGIQNPVVNGQNPCETGFQVNGNEVLAYGLSVQHTLGDQTQWYGDNGQCFFYEAEFPFDATKAYETNRFVGYRALPKVSNAHYSHTAYGIGVYCFFRDNVVIVANGILTSNTRRSKVLFTNALTRWLNGLPGSGIFSVINEVGRPVSTFETSYVAEYPS